MNAELFPLFDAVFPFARDIGELAGALTALSVAAVAIARPRLLRPGAITMGALALWFVGVAGTFLGLDVDSVGLLLVGTSLNKIGGTWLSLCILVACGTTLSQRQLLGGIPAAMALGCLAALAADPGSLPFALAVYALAAPAGVALIYPIARRAIRAIAAAPPAREAAITWPSSYLPLGNRLFVCIFAFSVATGFAQRFGPQEGRLDSVPIAVATFTALALYCLLHVSRQKFDMLLGLSVVFTMAGFLVVPVEGAAHVSAGALIVGDSCYQVLYDLVLFSLAARNRLASLSVISWGWGGSVLGIILGANAGAFAQSGSQPTIAYLASAAMATALLAYVLFGLRGFSFDATIEGIVPVEPHSIPQGAPGLSIEQACAELATARGLTTREADVLCLLAHGRNNSYIQEELGLTRNTVKSHIKLIYQKLDVHSQQELIDIASAGRNGGDPT